MTPGRVRLSQVALTAWSGGRFVRHGQALDAERLERLLRPDDAQSTIVTADVYGAGEADELVGRAIARHRRDDVQLVAAVGHDFYGGVRAGRRGYPRFTDPRLRGPDQYAGYLRYAVERSLRRLGVAEVDVLLLHNPDRRGFESPEVWAGLTDLKTAGLCRELGVAPGPANGFTLDTIGCLERYGGVIDWLMLILSPLEPWPGRLVLAAAQDYGVRIIARVVDHGGTLWGDVPSERELEADDHRRHRPPGWRDAAARRIDGLIPICRRRGITPMQLAAVWALTQEPVAVVAPTFIQERGRRARPVEDKRREFADMKVQMPLTLEEQLAALIAGDNRGTMVLKGATPEFDGPERADRWALDARLRSVAERWGIHPETDLTLRPRRRQPTRPDEAA